MADAACRGLDNDLFFPERGENLKIRKAKAVCATCEVMYDCLEYNLRTYTSHDDEGIWGGTTAKERRRIRRRRAILRSLS